MKETPRKDYERTSRGKYTGTRRSVLMPYTPRRKITPFTEEEKRLDYINNNDARMAIQNLRRAKGALKIVVNAVARGEFPGSKEG